MNDYERIAKVIHYLDEHQAEQPGLAMLAAQTGLSASHFHRLFSAWAGVTPKDFLQCLTLAHVKSSLRAGKTVLDTALDAGLSGPGRLHDLCVTLESASPGEMKAGGKGWTVVAGFGSTPFGTCLVGESPRGIVHLSFCDGKAETSAWADLEREWPNARIRRDDNAADRQVQRIFTPLDGRVKRGLRAFVRGTPFQLRVWRALVQVPFGEWTTYGRLAASIGLAAAARAVGSAVAANPVAYLIPCHRVIRETGVIGHYHWGPIRKRAMLTWEASRRDCQSVR